jgi:hypothetical protein
MGFPIYGADPFEDIGIDTTGPLLTAFALVCAAELVVGRMLWHRRRAGTVLAIALLPLEAAFWIGFALPLPALAGVIRTAMVAMAWLEMRRATVTTPVQTYRVSR